MQNLSPNRIQLKLPLSTSGFEPCLTHRNDAVCASGCLGHGSKEARGKTHYTCAVVRLSLLTSGGFYPHTRARSLTAASLSPESTRKYVPQPTTIVSGCMMWQCCSLCATTLVQWARNVLWSVILIFYTSVIRFSDRGVLQLILTVQGPF